MVDKFKNLQQTNKIEIYSALCSSVASAAIKEVYVNSGVVYSFLKFIKEECSWKPTQWLLSSIRVFANCIDVVIIVFILYLLFTCLFTFFDSIPLLFYRKKSQKYRMKMTAYMWETIIPNIHALSQQIELINSRIDTNPPTCSCFEFLQSITEVLYHYKQVLKIIKEKGYVEIVSEDDALSESYKNLLIEMDYSMVYQIIETNFKVFNALGEHIDKLNMGDEFNRKLYDNVKNDYDGIIACMDKIQKKFNSVDNSHNI